jgi:CheY-like chemotaxis protein
MVKKVLLVDDLLFDVILTRRALEECEVVHDIVVVCDGAEALLQLSKNHFDIILMDIKMPRVSGFEVLKNIRNNPSLSHIPVVIISASDLQADRIRAQALGALAYVHKAMEYREFQQSLQRTLAPHGFC